MRTGAALCSQELRPEWRRAVSVPLAPSSSSIQVSFILLSLFLPRPVLAVEAGDVGTRLSSRYSSGQLRKYMRTLTGVATSTAAMLRRLSSCPEGAGRRRLGPKRVAKLFRFILLQDALAATLREGGKEEGRRKGGRKGVCGKGEKVAYRVKDEKGTNIGAKIKQLESI